MSDCAGSVGRPVEVLLWVVGCNTHYLRWIVEPADGISSSCHEVEIDDCPDFVHHWYDHFYCDRPCFAGKAGSPGVAPISVTVEGARTESHS